MYGDAGAGAGAGAAGDAGAAGGAGAAGDAGAGAAGDADSPAPVYLRLLRACRNGVFTALGAGASFNVHVPVLWLQRPVSPFLVWVARLAPARSGSGSLMVVVTITLAPRDAQLAPRDWDVAEAVGALYGVTPRAPKTHGAAAVHIFAGRWRSQKCGPPALAFLFNMPSLPTPDGACAALAAGTLALDPVTLSAAECALFSGAAVPGAAPLRQLLDAHRSGAPCVCARAADVPFLDACAGWTRVPGRPEYMAAPCAAALRAILRHPHVCATSVESVPALRRVLAGIIQGARHDERVEVLVADSVQYSVMHMCGIEATCLNACKAGAGAGAGAGTHRVCLLAHAWSLAALALATRGAAAVTYIGSSISPPTPYAEPTAERLFPWVELSLALPRARAPPESAPARPRMTHIDKLDALAGALPRARGHVAVLASAPAVEAAVDCALPPLWSERRPFRSRAGGELVIPMGFSVGGARSARMRASLGGFLEVSGTGLAGRRRARFGAADSPLVFSARDLRRRLFLSGQWDSLVHAGGLDASLIRFAAVHITVGGGGEPVRALYTPRRAPNLFIQYFSRVESS